VQRVSFFAIKGPFFHMNVASEDRVFEGFPPLSFCLPDVGLQDPFFPEEADVCTAVSLFWEVFLSFSLFLVRYGPVLFKPPCVTIRAARVCSARAE